MSHCPSEGVTITHPYHPLFGKRVEVVRLRRGADPDLIIRLPDATHAAVAMSLTDYVGPPSSNVIACPLPLLDLAGLRQIAEHIAQRRHAGGSPAPAATPPLGSRNL